MTTTGTSSWRKAESFPVVFFKEIPYFVLVAQHVGSVSQSGTEAAQTPATGEEQSATTGLPRQPSF